MGFFSDDQDVYKYLGGVFRLAGEHPDVGPKLRGAGVTLRVVYTDPDSELTLKFHEPAVEVVEGSSDETPDITLFMAADIADRYWRGEYNLAVGLAKGHVKAKGPVNKILKLVPVTKPIFPLYRGLVAEKDPAAVA